MEIQRAPEIEKKRKLNDEGNKEIKEVVDKVSKPSNKESIDYSKTEESAELMEESSELMEESSQEVNTLSLTISPTVQQAVHVCAGHKKPRLLIRFITTVREQEKIHKVRQPGAMLIFATKIKSVKFVVDFLQRQGVQVDLLHGQLPQSQRERALNDFKAVTLFHIIACLLSNKHKHSTIYLLNYLTKNVEYSNISLLTDFIANFIPG
jgi:superfamily II DNA/RNA helicase